MQFAPAASKFVLLAFFSLIIFFFGARFGGRKRNDDGDRIQFIRNYSELSASDQKSIFIVMYNNKEISAEIRDKWIDNIESKRRSIFDTLDEIESFASKSSGEIRFYSDNSSGDHDWGILVDGEGKDPLAKFRFSP